MISTNSHHHTNLDERSNGSSLNVVVAEGEQIKTKHHSKTHERLSETASGPEGMIQQVVLEAIEARERGQSMNQIESYLEELSQLHEDM